MDGFESIVFGFSTLPARGRVIAQGSSTKPRTKFFSDCSLTWNKEISAGKAFPLLQPQKRLPLPLLAGGPRNAPKQFQGLCPSRRQGRFGGSPHVSLRCNTALLRRPS